MDHNVMAGTLVPGHVVLKGGLWAAAAVSTLIPAALLAISTLPTAKLPLDEALLYGIRVALFAASFMYLVYFITSQQIDREDAQGRYLMHGSRNAALAMYAATCQVVAVLGAALAVGHWQYADGRPPSCLSYCAAAYLATLVLAHTHQVFPATLWLWPLGLLKQQAAAAPSNRRVQPPPVPKDNLLLVGCRLYVAVLFWGLYVQLAPTYVNEQFALSHATIMAVAFTVAFVHGLVCSYLRWRSCTRVAADGVKKTS